MYLEKKQALRARRILRIRKKIKGTAERPRLCVAFTNHHIYAQAIDDETGRTLVYVSTLDKGLRDGKLHRNIAGAAALGTLMGEKAKAANIEKVVFDRHGRRYHGRIKAFADAAREAGLNF